MRVLFLDYSTRLETIRDLQNKARGGMVASLFKVSDYLAEVGYSVEVLSDITEPGTTNAGVKWVKDPSGRYDTLVLNRGVGRGYADIKAKRRILWTHDLPHAGFIQEPQIMRAFSHTVFMSRYAERVWRSFFPSIGESVLIPNGVDRSIFKPANKDQNLLIYASAPNRGLKRLPFLFEACKTVNSELKIKAFTNMKAQYPNEVRNEEEDGYSLAYKSARDAGVVLCDPIPQTALARQLGKAALMLLPTDYPEICSNIVLQALACGCPVVTTGNLGSVGEWIKHGKNGILTQWQPVDYMVYQAELIRLITRLMDQPGKLKRMQRNAAGTRLFSWNEIGTKWNKLLN